MKIGLVISYFDSIKELPRCLDSGDLYKHVDVIIGLDGRYEYFEADHDYSIDGSSELLRDKYKAQIIKYSGYQPVKRQIGLDFAGYAGCDFMIAIDSDEFIHPDWQDWDLFYKRLKYYSETYPKEQLFFMQMWMDNDYEKAGNQIQRGRYHKWIRIFKNPGNIKHCIGHHFIYCPKHLNDATPRNWLRCKHLIDGVRMATDSKLRDHIFLAKREAWAYHNHLEENRRMAKMAWNLMRKRALGSAISVETNTEPIRDTWIKQTINDNSWHSIKSKKGLKK